MSGMWRACCRAGVVRNALRIAAVVGTLLNLINQGDRLAEPATISWGHIVLNYLVPYVVASYSAARMQLQLQLKENDPDD